MKIAYAQPGGGIDSLEIRDAPEPQPGPGEALVRLTAASINYRDLMVIRGQSKLGGKPSYVPLSCGAGEVVAVGDGVTRVRVGDRVSPTFYQNAPDPASRSGELLGGRIDGTARQLAVFPVESLCRIPDELGDLEAATLPCAGLTAWDALFAHRPLQAGEWVLVQGTGGCSIAALQWAKAAGAHVVATSSSDAKLARARALGADVTINYRRNPDWAAATRQALGGRGVDIVVDVAGAGELPASARVLNDGGLIAAIGWLDGTDFSWAVETEHPVTQISVGTRDEHEAMLAFAAAHGIRPVVDVVYGLERLGDAMRHAESGAFFGKVGVGLL